MKYICKIYRTILAPIGISSEEHSAGWLQEVQGKLLEGAKKCNDNYWGNMLHRRVLPLVARYGKSRRVLQFARILVHVDKMFYRPVRRSGGWLALLRISKSIILKVIATICFPLDFTRERSGLYSWYFEYAELRNARRLLCVGVASP